MTAPTKPDVMARRCWIIAHDVLFAVGLRRAALWCLMRAAWRTDWSEPPR